MRPILFNKSETAFDTYGLGELNVTKGTVTRERNGNYTLYAEIPVSDPMVASIEKEMKLKADAGLRTKNQTFEISRIVKDSSNIVKIYGQHISHKLEYMVLRNATAFNGSAFSALSIWRGALIGDLTFDVWSDIQTTGKGVFDISKMENARLALGGVEGSILDIYGGEYEFDNMTVRLHKQLGRTAPTVLEYGRNILSAELDETIESAYTSVLPFATYTPDKPEGDTSDSQPDPITVTIPENYIDSKYKSLYAHRRIKVVDFSSEFKSDSKSKDIPTPDKLRKIAIDYMERNAIGKPKINIKIEYADLAKTLDYADNGWIEELELCDIVPIYYPQIGLTDETAKVTTVTYDFVNERNESVEFGDIGTNVRATMQSGLAGRVDDIAKAQQDFENSLPDYLLNAQGNKVWYNKPDDKEHKVGDIWFEKNGIYDRMYVWNGSQWEKRIDTEDVDKIKKEVDKQLEQAKQSTAIEIEKANAKAQEALIKAGTIPDTATLSDQIKTLILNSPDLGRKVTETFNNADNGDTIYSKVYSKVAKNFASRDQFENIDREQNRQGSDLLTLSKKIETQTLEFNKLTESNKIYERILGKSETEAPDKLSRLVMSSEIFQTEVGKYSTSGGPNMLRNSRADDGLKYWTEANGRLNFTAHKFYLNGQKRMFSLRSGAFVHSPRFIIKQNTNYMLNLIAFDANTARFKIAFCKRRKGSTNDFDEMQIIFDETGSPAFNSDRAIKKSFSFNTGAFDEGYLLFNYQGNPNGWSGLFMTELDFYEGSSDRLWQPSPDDSAEPIEAVRTQVSQLAGSWSVKNLSSAGDVLNSINLLANGTNRIDGSLTHITGQTVIDNAVIEDGMIANVSANKVTAGTIDAREVNLINLNAKSVTSGTFKGLTFEGGIIRGNYGNTEINLNSNVTTYNGTAKIEFRSPYNSLEFNSGGRKAFLAPTISSGTNYAAFALGVNDRGEGNPNANFTGLKIFNQYGHRKVVIIGDVHIVKDSVSNNAPSKSLVDLFRDINDNFKRLKEFRVANGEGSPGFWDVSL
ncbi:phage tail spike protein [Streptococcus sp. S5]|uniref:Phage tail spike protein n=1 Tax=Streptococcus lingualis TaxID=3098076 RepID=A0ABZ0T1A5_9STRE|nr:phage tail spike protein [Streptococcus sp. S5]WPS47605.1 phage tail spike protein [Streptococcus sp. S5]